MAFILPCIKCKQTAAKINAKGQQTLLKTGDQLSSLMFFIEVTLY